jgi:hypothetical protein
MNNGEGSASLQDQSGAPSNDVGQKQGYERDAQEFERPVLAGVEVGPKWGALYRDPILTQRSERNAPVPQVSVSRVEGMQ